MDHAPLCGRLVSGREAARVLATGPALSRAAVRRVLAAGLAGQPIPTSTGPLYRGEAVHALLRRPVVAEHDLDRLGLPALVVARRAACVLDPVSVRREEIADGWDLNVWHRVGMQERINRTGPLPLVATVSGFVVLGADLVGFTWSEARKRRGGSRLRLADAGGWFEHVRGLRLMTGPGRPFRVFDWATEAQPSIL